MHNRLKTLAELIATRQQILESGDGWKRFDDRKVDDAMKALTNVEREIIAAPCASEDDKLKVLSILLDSNDAPGFADDFKNSLFFRLRSLSS